MAKNCPEKTASTVPVEEDIYAAPKKGESQTRTIKNRELKFCLKCKYQGKEGRWASHLSDEHDKVMKQREKKAKAAKKKKEEE